MACEVKNTIEATPEQIRRFQKLINDSLESRVIPIGNLSVEEWLILRSLVGVGSSEIATALGKVPPWFNKTPLKIWKEKVGHIIEIVDNPTMRIGRGVEETIVQEYEYLTGKRVMRVKDKMFLHPKHDNLFSDLDGIILPVSGDGYRVLECKSTVSHVYDSWENLLPSYYFRQSMGELSVINEHPFLQGAKFEGVDFATLILDKREVKILPINFDEKFIAEQNDEILAWYAEYVLNNVPPPECAAEWAKTEPTAGSFVECTSQGYDIYKKLLGIQSQIAVLEEQESELKDGLIQEIKDNENLLYAGEIIATYKQTNRTDVDGKKLKIEKPDIYEQFKKVISYRTLKPKKISVLEY